MIGVYDGRRVKIIVIIFTLKQQVQILKIRHTNFHKKIQPTELENFKFIIEFSY